MSSYRLGILIRRFSGSRLLKQPVKLNLVQNFATISQKNEPSIWKLALLGVGLGAATGTIYSICSNLAHSTDHMIHEKRAPQVIDNVPNVRIAKRIVHPKDVADLELVLFQFQTCPFCCKVRSFLDFKGLSYSVVEVDAVLKQDLKWSNYKKVPMVLAKTKDGKYIQLTDSSTIISVIASYMHNKEQDIGELAKLYPGVTYFDDNGQKKEDVMNKYFLMFQENLPKSVSKEDMEEERKWRNWVDSHLVHLISPNVYRTRKEAFKTFEWFSEAGDWSVYFPKWERDMMVYVGATAMWLISKRLKKRHGLSDDVRSHIYDALDKWTQELDRKKTKFMGGARPNLADLSAFGVLSSMEGCDAFKDCLKNTRIGGWFYAVKDVVNKNKGHIVKNHQHTSVENVLPEIA